MYPRRDITVDASMPTLDEYWVPKPVDIDGDGYGLNFRDVCALENVTITEARGVLDWERAAANWVASNAPDEESFEKLARLVESYNSVDGFEPEPDSPKLPDELQGTDYSLWALELGVSGLSYVLAATGFYPVASCRSHAGHSWSEVPVVFFAASEARLRLLHPLVVASGCGLSVDATRGRPLLVVDAPSIVETMDLARRLFERRRDFKSLPKTDRKQSSSPKLKRPDEPTLF